MNISSEIFPTDGSNSSDPLLFNRTVEEDGFGINFIPGFINLLWCFPINSYVIWLIVTGTGNGFAAEFFSLNLAVLEMLFCMEAVMFFLSSKFNILWMAVVFLDGFPTTGRPLFQCLICVERYLAVVHPVTFLKYKPLRYRVICCVITWVVATVSCLVNILWSLTVLFYLSFCTQFFFFLFFQLFCCLAVLRALKQSGTGKENHIRRKAFYLILITNVTMAVLYTPFIILFVVSTMSNHRILMSISYTCFTLAGLVQPLLFLYRVGKLPFIKN